MPSTSKKQHIAMQIAAAGKSNLDIPKSVGKDFLAADKAAGKYQPKKTNEGLDERRQHAIDAYFEAYPDKSRDLAESFEFTFFSDGTTKIIDEEGNVFEDMWANLSDTASSQRANKPVAKAEKPAEPKVHLPASKTTHLIKHPSGLTTPHVGDDASAHAAAAKVGGTVKKVAPMKEAIEQLIQMFASGDRVGAAHLIEEILMEKVAPYLDEMKIVVAEKHLNLDEVKLSAKAGAAGKDLGKPGKNFDKIATKAGKKYGSKERGEKVAGAILAKMRAKAGIKGGAGH